MRVAVLFIIASLLAAACDTSLHPTIAGFGQDSCAVQAVLITPDTATLHVGATLQPTAQVQSCAASATEGVRWSSTDATVLTVDSISGFIQARGVGRANAVASAVADRTVKGALVIAVTP
jgi:uncharacterized protein YjdB